MRRRALAQATALILLVNGVAVTGPVAGAAGIALERWGVGAAGPALIVDLSAERHHISPDIYGMNFASEDLAAELRLPVRRWGGNATTRYHYAYDTTNRGSDWYFENVPGGADPTHLPNGSETDQFVDQDRRTGSSTILTVPLIGWVPKGRDYSCGFSVIKYGTQVGKDAQWRPDCGNGITPDGTLVTGNDPYDTSARAGAEYVTDWLEHLKGRYGTAAEGGVKFYSFDNEPDSWHSTHRDVHPTGASYKEIRDSTVAIGAAVKTVDPTSSTLGPVGWGWNSLSMSGLDQETCSRLGGDCWSNPPDRMAHGGAGFGEWYLAQLRAYEQQHGIRLLDYFDNHWFPQGAGVAFGDGGNPATNALRLRSTRNLWDPNYVDESWINDKTRLIPRMKEMVNANYPGTKTAISEYNWGGQKHINGALAQADVLGIFGREGLDLATLWGPPGAGDPVAYAFRMFLNYDGHGAGFGDTSVRATSADQDRLAIYAAQTAGQPLTVVVINKTGEELSSDIAISGRLPRSSRARAWRYGEANPAAIIRTEFGLRMVSGHAGCPPAYQVRGVFPANSITTIAIGR